MNTNFYKPFLALIIINMIGLSGCSNTSVRHHTKASPSAKQQANNTVAINLKALQTIPTIAPNLAKYKVVFVGESHTNYSNHLNQLAIIKSLHKHWGNKISIGLEMIQQPYQSYLDEYVAGNINEREMLKGTQWYDRWVYDFRLYRPIFNYAKKNKIPLVAINIPKELTKRITKVGISGLNKSERQQLPTFIDRSNKKYEKRIKSVFSGHMKTSSKGFEKFFDAQLACHEGMAFNAMKYLKKHPTKRMVLLAGGGHIIGRSGIPNRLDRQNKSTSMVVLNNISTTLNPSQGDYFLDSKEVKLPPKGLMGIFMDDSDKGVIVKNLTTHGSAKKAGLQKGDIIISLNNDQIQTSSDVKLWTLDKKPNGPVALKIKRNNKEYDYRFLLKGPSKKQMHGLKHP